MTQMQPWRPKKGTRKNLEAWFTQEVRTILHGNNICFRNHEINIEVISPSQGRVKIYFDGERSDYLEGEVLQRYDRTKDVPQMEWYDTFNRDMAVRGV